LGGRFGRGAEPPSEVLERPVRRLPPIPPPPLDGDGDRWSGGGPDGPPLDNARLGILIFLAGETMLFASFVAGFVVLRVGAAVWPPPMQPRLPVLVTGLNTLCLLASSLAMRAAVRALRRGDRRTLLRGLGLTALLGGVFLAVQGIEWVRLIRFGLTVSSGVYGGTFYTLIGLHGAHVVGALLWLAVVALGVRLGRLGPRRPTPVSLCATYWHYVVAVWPILYVLVYLR
jgi:heme/copper-type cytochrome/quinol oxidase subunit 3